MFYAGYRKGVVVGLKKQVIHKQAVLSDTQFGWSNSKAAVSPLMLAKDKSLKEKILTPLMRIDIGEILRGWMQDWNETPDTCTEEWELTAFPVMADGKIALLFRSPVCAFGTDEDGNIVSNVIENMYRVLLYDPKTGKIAGKYRFKIYRGYICTVFFRNGRLYAAVSSDSKCEYTALQMWPGPDEGHQVKIGNNINSIAVTQAGDIVASYAFDREGETEHDEETPLLSIFRMNGIKESYCGFYDAENDMIYDDYIIDVTLDIQDRIWALMDDGETVTVYDNDGGITTGKLPVTDVITVALPDDGSCIYACTEDKNDNYRLFCIATPEKGMGNKGSEESAPEICAIKTEDGTAVTFKSISCMKSIAAVQIEDMLYVIDLNNACDLD